MVHLVKGSQAAKDHMKAVRAGKKFGGGGRKKSNSYSGGYPTGFRSTGLGYGRSFKKRAPKGMGKKYVPGSGKTGMTLATWRSSQDLKDILAAGREKRRNMGSRVGHPYVMRKCRREAQEIVNSLNHAKFKTAAQWKRGVNQMLGRHSRFGHVSPNFGRDHRAASIAAFNYVKTPSLPKLPTIPIYADMMSDDYMGKMSGFKHTMDESTTSATSTGKYKKSKV